jgi:hypothetical protein
MKKESAVKQIAALLKAKIAEGAPEGLKASPEHEAGESPEKEMMEEHEAAESPEKEMAEEQATAGMPEHEMGEEHGGDMDIEHLLSQLPPEQLEQLANSLSADIQDPQATQGGDEIAQLAHAIQAHLSQNPEASVDLPDHEQAAALDSIKSAAYIEGFIKQAVAHGTDIEQAVTMYDNILSSTIGQLKQAELKGNQHKLDVDHDGKIEASDLKKLREGKKTSGKEETKVAAYYEGIIERAREYGIHDSDTIAFVKAANDGAMAPFMDKAQAILEQLKGQGGQAMEGISDKLHGLQDTAMQHIHSASPLQLAGAGAGVGALGAAGLAHMMNRKDKQKQRLQMMQGMLEGGNPQATVG